MTKLGPNFSLVTKHIQNDHSLAKFAFTAKVYIFLRNQTLLKMVQFDLNGHVNGQMNTLNVMI